MRRALILALLGTLCCVGPAGAQIVDHTGGKVVDGTPVAIAVRGPEGAIGGWGRSGGGSGPRWTCGYHATGVVSGVYEAWTVEPEPTSPQASRVYALICRDGAGAVVHESFVFYDPADPLGGLVAGDRAAELAREELHLPDLPMVLSPPGDQLVGVPTWLALDMAWEPISASASVSNVTATVVAVPTSVSWQLGDGTTVSCSGPGVLFDPALPFSEQGSDCTHTYTWPSTHRPDGKYVVDATVSYELSWSATDGSSGGLDPVSRTSSRSVRVTELQAFIR